MESASRTRRRTIAALFTGCVALLSTFPVHALVILPTQDGNGTLWFMTLCGDGSMNGPWSSYGQALSTGGVLCNGHGGIADIQDVDVQMALADPQTCSVPSNVTLERDLGGGVVRSLTPAEFQAFVDASGGAGRVQPDLFVGSVVVRGVELDPSPTRDLQPLPLTAIYSDENEDGQFVGGPTGCAAAVPMMAPFATSALAALMGGVVVWRERRGARSTDRPT